MFFKQLKVFICLVLIFVLRVNGEVSSSTESHDQSKEKLISQISFTIHESYGKEDKGVFIIENESGMVIEDTLTGIRNLKEIQRFELEAIWSRIIEISKQSIWDAKSDTHQKGDKSYIEITFIRDGKINKIKIYQDNLDRYEISMIVVHVLTTAADLGFERKKWDEIIPIY